MRNEARIRSKYSFVHMVATLVLLACLVLAGALLTGAVVAGGVATSQDRMWPGDRLSLEVKAAPVPPSAQPICGSGSTESSTSIEVTVAKKINDFYLSIRESLFFIQGM